MKRQNIIFTLVSFLCIGILLTGFNYSPEKEIQQELVIPSADEIRENGYPVNENGERYGYDVLDNTETSPELILAQNEDGLLGYIRASDMDRLSPSTPEEAAGYEPEGYYINMYLQDGKTQIGKFYIEKGSYQMR